MFHFHFFLHFCKLLSLDDKPIWILYSLEPADICGFLLSTSMLYIKEFKLYDQANGGITGFYRQSTDEKNDFTYGFGRYVKTFGSSVNIDDWIRTKLWIAEKKETHCEVVNR